MSFDLSSLSSDPLLYFLAHSTLFVVIIAAIFFTFGLAFGWFTWARYKSQRHDLLSESESLKGEIATLKRKLAEQIARASSLADAAPPAGAQTPRPAHVAPDAVVSSFLTTAATIFPQTEKQAAPAHAPEPQTPITPSAPAGADQGHMPVETSKPRKPTITSKVKPKKIVSQTLSQNDAGHELTVHAGDEPAPPHSSSATPSPVVPPAPVGSDGGSRLLSDPHLGLVYAARPGLSDELSHLKGVASVIEGKLNDYGVYTFKQIALWSEENIREFSNLLAFKDRIHREQWVEQARELHYQKYGERV